MTARVPLYHAVLTQLQQLPPSPPVRPSSLVRLALLITGIIAARSCVLQQVAQELFALGLTLAASAEAIARRLRRTLNDLELEADLVYAPALRQMVVWSGLGTGGQPRSLIVDASSHTARYHLLRVSLAYRGSSLPIAWLVWAQNTRLPAGDDWYALDEVLAQVAAWLPPGVTVIVLADRAYDIPPFLDRLHAYGWHGIVRGKARSRSVLRTHQGQTRALADLLATQLPGPGHRCKLRAHLFQRAGWREVSLVAHWGRGHAEPLVVLSDLPPRWALLAAYRRRAWVEPGFRNDKTRGWHWEQTQVQGLAHHQRLLVALAWASLLMICLGVGEAQHRLARRAHHSPTRTQARASPFTLGLQCVRHSLYRRCPLAPVWSLPDPTGPSWRYQWATAHITPLLFAPVRP